MRPPEPISGLVFLPKYRIRFDDGSELVIPSVDGLEQRVRRGEIRPDTVIFDAGRGIWCRAAEAPLVKAILNEIGPEPVVGWQTERAAPRSVAPDARDAAPFGVMGRATGPASIPEPRQAAEPDAILLKSQPLAAESYLAAAEPSTAAAKSNSTAAEPPAPATSYSATAEPLPAAAELYLTPEPYLATEATEESYLAPAESYPSVAESYAAAAGRSAVAMARRVPFPVTTRGRVAVTSLVGSVGIAALGFVVFQSPEMSANDLSALPPMVRSSNAPVTQPESSALLTSGDAAPSPPSASEAASAASSRSSMAPRGSTPSSAPPLQASRSAAISNPTPSIGTPAIPLLTEGQIAGHIDTAGSNLGSSPIVIRPTPATVAGGTVDPFAASASVPYTQAPRVINADRVQQALDREYPIGLRALGIGGRVELSFYIDEEGQVEQFETQVSSGNKDLDQAALRVARVFQFSPALRGRERVPTRYSLGVTFSGGTGALGPAGNAVAAPPARGAANASDQPVPTQFDVAPKVNNTAQVRSALDREYPNVLRDQGIGGRVEVWFYINEQGGIDAFQLKQSSGNSALDQAAMRVAQVFEFIPGTRGDQPLAGWVSVGITFNATAPVAMSQQGRWRWTVGSR